MLLIDASILSAKVIFFLEIDLPQAMPHEVGADQSVFEHGGDSVSRGLAQDHGPDVLEDNPADPDFPEPGEQGFHGCPLELAAEVFRGVQDVEAGNGQESFAEKTNGIGVQDEAAVLFFIVEPGFDADPPGDVGEIDNVFEAALRHPASPEAVHEFGKLGCGSAGNREEGENGQRQDGPSPRQSASIFHFGSFS